MPAFGEQLTLWILLTLYQIAGFNSDSGCDTTIDSREYSSKNGTFDSPNWPNEYPNNLCCMYKFIGTPDERVQIQFTGFNLQGVPPSCTSDYVDVYTQMTDPFSDLLEEELTARFCGDLSDGIPPLIISRQNILLIVFYSDMGKAGLGFSGKFQFLDDAVYNIGTEAPQSVCGYTVKSGNKGLGYLLSPTYPGMYPDDSFCYYKLQGRPKERIKLTFVDFSLFHGGEYCPFDYLKVYDGHTNQAQVIGVFCGQYKNLVLYSSGEALHLEFRTRSGRVNFETQHLDGNSDFAFERRGFNITYEFSKQFVDLDFIPKESVHIPGTECDQRILSRGNSIGNITSPNYGGKIPTNVTCHYIFDGIKERQRLEKTRISFYDFNIPGSMPYCMLGYLGVNYGGKMDEVDDENKFCGDLLPPNMVSDNPRLVLVLNTHGVLSGRGFKAKYEFITNFGIPGKQIVDGECKFLFDSMDSREGIFNSPLHINPYPTNITCDYFFRPGQGYKILLAFEVFHLCNKSSSAICDKGDRLEIYEQNSNNSDYTLLMRYCKSMMPGPFLTATGLKVVFHSDSEGTMMGFKGRYEFITDKSLLTKSEMERRWKLYSQLSLPYSRGADCGQYIVSSGTGGIITSPEYPLSYKPSTFCEWHIKASSISNKIQLQLAVFEIEGDQQSELQPGCENAVLRVYARHSGFIEKCGVNINLSVISDKDSIRISFVTSSKSLGAKGFKLSWTELHRSGECGGFHCTNTNHCIANELKCNNLPNCGQGDRSDETEDCPSASSIQILHIAIGTSLSSFFCIVLIVCGFYHRKKFSDQKPKEPEREQTEVRYVSSSGCHTTDRLLSLDSPRFQKVSIV